MPIPVKGVVDPTPIPETPVPIPEPQPKPSFRTEISWITPSLKTPAGRRTEIRLTGDISGLNRGIIVQPGIKGFDAAPYVLTLDDLPALDGSVFRHVRAATREVMIPLFLWAPDREALVGLKRDLLKVMNPKAGPGTLRVVETGADGLRTARYLDCYYVGGLEGDDQEGTGFLWCMYGLTLQAPDPYWYGDLTSPTSPLKASSTVPVNFFTGKPKGDPGDGPFLGLNLSDVTYVDDQTYTLANPGDIEAWPVWTIRATGAKWVRFSDVATGQMIWQNYAFNSLNDPVTIDTRPGYKTIRNAAGINLWELVTGNPQLFPLKPGDTQVKIEFEPATELSTVEASVDYNFYPRYLGA